MIDKKKIAAIIQARLGSKRLPGKSAKKIGNKYLIEHIIERLQECKNLDNIVLATTNREEDSTLVGIAQKYRIKYYRGSEYDVLSRFFYAAKEFNLKEIVRICGDNPFFPIEEVDRLVENHIKNRSDYTTNILPNGELVIKTGLGFAVEVISFIALDKCFKEAKKFYDKEHVTPYIYNNRSDFKVNFLKIPDYLYLENLRLTIDTEEDLELIRDIYKNLSDKCTDTIKSKDIVSYIKDKSSILKKMSKLNAINKK